MNYFSYFWWICILCYLKRNKINNSIISFGTIYDKSNTEAHIFNKDSVFIVYITDHQCFTCVEEAIGLLQKIQKSNLLNKLYVLGDFIDPKTFFNLLEEYDLLKYGYLIQPLKRDNELAKIRVPLLLLLDKFGTVQEIYYLDKYYPLDYYKQILRILND